MQVTFERSEELAPNIWQFYFLTERSLDFVPGQYIHLHLNGLGPDPRGKSRTFTLTSLPDDPFISFVAKFVEPMSPYKQYLLAMRPGDKAHIDDAMGDLVLPKDRAQPLVFIAGGIGMASYASMFSWLIKRKEQRTIFLFYSVRSVRDQIFRDVTNAYPLELKTLTIAPNRLTAQQIKDSTPPDALVYLSGSITFVQGLRDRLGMLNTPRDHIIFDYFDGYTDNTI